MIQRLTSIAARRCNRSGAPCCERHRPEERAMSRNGLLPRERLDATIGSVTGSAAAQTTRVLRDDELDAVSGGFRVEIGSLPCSRCLGFLDASMVYGVDAT